MCVCREGEKGGGGKSNGSTARERSSPRLISTTHEMVSYLVKYWLG